VRWAETRRDTFRRVRFMSYMSRWLGPPAADHETARVVVVPACGGAQDVELRLPSPNMQAQKSRATKA